uniref:Uncharacterized protein n=1 Tax=Romanomermis culicivorax TaxID=13658 RepID=A0A915IL42_ROMCU
MFEGKLYTFVHIKPCRSTAMQSDERWSTKAEELTKPSGRADGFDDLTHAIGAIVEKHDRIID